MINNHKYKKSRTNDLRYQGVPLERRQRGQSGQYLDRHTKISKTAHTLLELKELILNYTRLNYSKSTSKLYHCILKEFYETIGNIPLSAIDTLTIEKYKMMLLDRVSPMTVNIAMRTLRAAFSKAVRWKMIDVNPFDDVEKVRVPATSPKYITTDEFSLLIKGIKEPWLKNIVEFAVLTGLRRGELINLKWSNINMEHKLLLVESSATFKTKMGKRRSVPLSDTAVELLARMKADSSSEYVFTRKCKQLTDSWLSHKFKKTLRASGLDEGHNFHGLRHSFASWLAISGVSIYKISILLGHADVKITQTHYAYLQPENLRDSVNLIKY